MKNSILIFVFLLPFVSFALSSDDFKQPTGVRVYSFTSFTSAANFQTSYSTVTLLGSDPYFSFTTLPFGLAFNNQGIISVPAQGLTVYTNSAYDIKFPIRSQPTNSTSNVYLSPYLFPRIYSLFRSVVNLYLSGYRGPGVSVVFDGSQTAANFNFPLIVSDVLSSTNTVYRSLILQHLNSINASLSSIDSTLSSLGSSVVSISNNINPDLFRTDFENTILSYASIGVIYPSYANEMIYSYNNLSPSERSSFAQSVADYVRSKDTASGFVSGLLSESLDDLSSIGSKFNRNIENALTGGSSSVSGGIAGDLKRLSTNDWASVVTNQLAQNTRDSKQQLRDNHDSITNQLSHMFDDNPNSVGRAIRSTAANTATAAQGVSAISSKLDSLHVQIDNPNSIGVILDGPVTIDTTQFNGVSVPLTGLKDKIHTWYNDWYSFWDISTPAYSWDNFYNMIRDFKDQNHSDISSITNLPFFSAVSNSLASIDKFLQTNSFSSSLHALLLDDYADYITNRFYSSAVDTFKDDYPSVYTNLVKFGLSTEDGEGNFWSLISSTLFYQSALVCGMLEDLATVRQFADDHIEGGFSGGVTSLIEKMPSSTELADRVNMASNEVLKIEAAAKSFYASYDVMTNTAVSAFSPFRGIFSSVPENLVFFKTGNEQYITIPVSQGGNAWSVIRLCFSFSLIAVNVILFPKFVLMVIVLLSKLSKRFVKFVPTDNI